MLPDMKKGGEKGSSRTTELIYLATPHDRTYGRRMVLEYCTSCQRTRSLYLDCLLRLRMLALPFRKLYIIKETLRLNYSTVPVDNDAFEKRHDGLSILIQAFERA